MAHTRPRLVLDTNVVVSALLNPGGLEAGVLGLVDRGDATIFVSEAVMAEYAEVLARPKFRRLDRATVAAALELIGAVAVTVRPRVKSALSPDASDNCFYECAQAARADYLVTGNKRHFPVPIGNTRIVNARELEKELSAG